MNDLKFILQDTLGHYRILDFLKIPTQVLPSSEIDSEQYNIKISKLTNIALVPNICVILILEHK